MPVVRRLFERVGLSMGTVYGLRGKSWLDERLAAYNQAARHRRWFVLRDLDGDAHCAPDLIARLLPDRASGMCLRIAVRAIESWVLADRERLASFLSVSVNSVPRDPDSVAEPKMKIVDLARKARRRAIREDMVPAAGTSARVGPGYSSRIIEFVSDAWRPDIARTTSPSLARCIDALDEWVS